MKKASVVLLGLAAVGLVVSFWSAPSTAQPGFGMKAMALGGPLEGPGMMLRLLLKGLELTAEQETRVRGIMGTHRENLRTLFGQLHAANEGMADKLFTPGELKEEEFSPQIQQITQLREQLMREGLRAMLEVRKELTPEQLAKAAQVKERMQALHEEMRSLFHGKGSGAKGEGPEEGDVIFFEAPAP